MRLTGFLRIKICAFAGTGFARYGGFSAARGRFCEVWRIDIVMRNFAIMSKSKNELI